MPPTETAALAARVLKGLDALHRRQVVHGGVRPSRIFHERIAKKGWHVKLLGAGVTSLTRREWADDAALQSYAPPEWLATGGWGAASDVYAVAIMMRHCMTGAAGVPREGAVEPGSERERDLAALIAECTSPNVAARPDSAAAMLDRVLKLYPEREPTGQTGRSTRWTEGRFVGRSTAVPLALPPAVESRTTVARNQKAAIVRARSVAVAVTATMAALVVLGLFVQAQRRERVLAEMVTTRSAAAHAIVVTAAARVETHAQPTASARTVVAPASDASVVAVDTAPAHHESHARPPSASTTATSGTNPNVSGAPSPRSDGASAEVSIHASEPCALVFDGTMRGEIGTLRVTVAPGTHQITCRRHASTQRLVVHAIAGRRVVVQLLITGEAEISSEAMEGTVAHSN